MTDHVMDKPLAAVLDALPSTPTVVGQVPMVWKHQTSGVLYAGGAALTADQLIQHAKAANPNATDFQVAAPSIVTWLWAGGSQAVYVGEPAVAEFYLAPSVDGDDVIWRWDGRRLSWVLARSELNARTAMPSITGITDAVLDRLWAEMTSAIPSAPLCQEGDCGVSVLGTDAQFCDDHTPTDDEENTDADHHR